MKVKWLKHYVFFVIYFVFYRCMYICIYLLFILWNLYFLQFRFNNKNILIWDQ